MDSSRQVISAFFAKKSKIFLFTAGFGVFLAFVLWGGLSAEEKTPPATVSGAAIGSCCSPPSKGVGVAPAASQQVSKPMGPRCGSEAVSQQTECLIGPACGSAVSRCGVTSSVNKEGLVCPGSRPVVSFTAEVASPSMAKENRLDSKVPAGPSTASCGCGQKAPVAGKAGPSCAAKQPPLASCCGEVPQLKSSQPTRLVAGVNPRSSIIILTDEQMKRLKGGHCTCGECSSAWCSSCSILTCYYDGCGEDDCSCGDYCSWDSWTPCGMSSNFCYQCGGTCPGNGGCSWCSYTGSSDCGGNKKSCPTSCTNCSGNGTCLICADASLKSCSDFPCSCIAYGCGICALRCITAPCPLGRIECGTTNCGNECPGNGDCEWCSFDTSPNKCNGIQHCGCGCNGSWCAPRCSLPGGAYEPCGGEQSCSCGPNCGCDSYCKNGNRPCIGSRNCSTESSPNCDPCTSCCCFCRRGGSSGPCAREPLHDNCVPCWSFVGCMCTCH